MTTAMINSTLAGLVAISKIPAGEEYTVRQMREKLATLGLAVPSDSVMTRMVQEAVIRGLLIKTRKKVQQPRKERPSGNSTVPTPVFVRTDVTHIHAPPGRVEEAEKALGLSGQA